jgi:hypothetical protein
MHGALPPNSLKIVVIQNKKEISPKLSNTFFTVLRRPVQLALVFALGPLNVGLDRSAG